MFVRRWTQIGASYKEWGEEKERVERWEEGGEEGGGGREGGREGSSEKKQVRE